MWHLPERVSKTAAKVLIGLQMKENMTFQPEQVENGYYADWKFSFFFHFQVD